MVSGTVVAVVVVGSSGADDVDRHRALRIVIGAGGVGVAVERGTLTPQMRLPMCSGSATKLIENGTGFARLQHDPIEELAERDPVGFRRIDRPPVARNTERSVAARRLRLQFLYW